MLSAARSGRVAKLAYLWILRLVKNPLLMPRKFTCRLSMEEPQILRIKDICAIFFQTSTKHSNIKAINSMKTT